jgi:hypothetical protein
MDFCGRIWDIVCTETKAEIPRENPLRTSPNQQRAMITIMSIRVICPTLERRYARRRNEAS